MTDSDFEKEFSRYWRKKHYVLVMADNKFGYTIQDEEVGSFVIIETDEVIPKVIERMIENGCKIYSSSKDLPERIIKPWVSIEELANFGKIAKEFDLDKEDVDEVSRRVSGLKSSREEIIKIIREFKRQ